MVASVINFFTGLFATVSNAVRSFMTTVINFFQQLGRDIISTLASLPGKMVEVGRNIIDGIVTGLRNAASAVTNFLIGLAQDALGAVKRFLGIASPSRVFRDQVGRRIGEGLAQGIKDSTGGVIAQAKAMSEAATRAASTSIGVASLNTDAARGFGGLAPNSAPGITSTSAPLPVTIPIHIGDEVVRVVRTEIDTSNRDVRRTVRAGAGVTAG
jgi:phage-related protein